VCGSCGTPLVLPGRATPAAVERGVAGAIVAASACAVVWMLLVRSSGSPHPAAVGAAGLVIGSAAWAAARVRGTGVQIAAGAGVTVFFVLGSFLVYRQALEAWLIRLHEAEGAQDAFIRAQEELADMDLSKFVHLVSTMPVFVGLAVAFALALLVTRAPRAVAAFATPAPSAAAEPPPEPESEPGGGPEPVLRVEEGA
jgi:hypothetical protein